ncbi:serine hydrolase domain-containing protein [Streptomyces zagrosensis]|uniref:D-alanyl-D-alanine carboxypeptidase n=1 Tax=Streptomyces zagrosensis TaxID=1042984 RepID=A0A7W9Q9B3_9ACTN|nr:serine hydrolase domain-containing protein [Streptomyces zagrosensis]MBB5935931.1 D-alanyl-D-alanine carboxypeptidase [Streptomyces zagrosensis]
MQRKLTTASAVLAAVLLATMGTALTAEASSSGPATLPVPAPSSSVAPAGSVAASDDIGPRGSVASPVEAPSAVPAPQIPTAPTGLRAPYLDGGGVLPSLDAGALREAISGLPNEKVTSALVKVSGTEGEWAGTSGVADVRTGRPVPAHGAFRIGSVSKVFTAAVVLQLVAEDKVDLGTSVQHYLPGLLPASYPDVSVRQLLNHTSGLPASEEGSGDAAWFVRHRFDHWTPQEVIASATKKDMDFAPGSQQSYNGTNYFVAGLLIEKATRESYAHEIDRRVLRPLGLHRTYVPDRRDVRLPGPHAHGYVRVDGRLVDITEQSPYSWAEGGLISTSADLTRFFTALYAGKVVPRPQLAEMFTVPDVAYSGKGNCRVPGDPHAGRACFSVGLTRTTWSNGVTAWGKSGAVPGYTTAVFATRDSRRVLAYSLTATGNQDGSELPYIVRLLAATFDPSLTEEARETGGAGRTGGAGETRGAEGAGRS